MHWDVVAAFTGPLIGAMGLIGGFVAWIVKRSQDRLKNEFRHYGELNTAQLKISSERFDAMQKTLELQQRTLENQQNKVMEIAVSVARIEGSQFAEQRLKEGTK